MTSDNKASTSKPAAKPKPSNFCVQLHRRVGTIPLVLFIQLRSLARVLTSTPLWSRSLLENPRDPENLRWVDGQMDQFQICVNEENALAALRPTLDFKSMSSFVRQLSYYDFKRLSDRRKSNERRGEARCIIFTHQSGLFVRGNPANVELMKRKLRVRAERGRRASAVSATSVDEDHSQAGSPLFSPTGTTWTTSDNAPPLPSPGFQAAFSSGMGSFSLTAPPPARGFSGSSSHGDPSQPRWQPYTTSDGPPAFAPAPPLHSPSTYEPQRYAPYNRAPLALDRRASAVSTASDLSPRSKSVELAYYTGTSARTSSSSMGPLEASHSGATAFSNPFSSQAFPSPSAQPSHYFPSSRHPASPSSTPLTSNTVPTGLPLAYEHPAPHSSSETNLSHSAESPYPPLSAQNQYRPSVPSSFHYPSQPPPEQQRPDPSTFPHLGFRNHQRFSSVPSQPPYPYPQFSPTRAEEYQASTSGPDEDLAQRAALEARRTSYPFPLRAPDQSNSEQVPAPSYAQPQTFESSTPSPHAFPDWSPPKAYYAKPSHGPSPNQPIAPPSHSDEWVHESTQQYARPMQPPTGTTVGGSGPARVEQQQQHQSYYQSYGGSVGGLPNYEQQPHP
ncbi:hypothetical protein JCM16303_001728 [Sporobolomyces ruberrimus]